MSSTLRSIGIETAKTLYDTIRGRDSNFLFFLGGAETVTGNKNTIDDDNVIWENINFLQKVRDTDVSIVARRVNWSSGTVYYPYDSSGIPESGMSGGEKNYYVMNEDNEVFVCMSANARNRKDQFGLSNSTVKPTRGNNNTVLSDGYRWKFLYKVDLAEGRFLTKTYMPVPDLNEYDTIPTSISPREEAFRRGCGNNTGLSGSCCFYHKTDFIDPVTQDTFSKGDLDFCIDGTICSKCFSISNSMNRDFTFTLGGDCETNICEPTRSVKEGYEKALDQQRKLSPNRNTYLQANVYKEAKENDGQIQSVFINLFGLSESDLTVTEKDPVVIIGSLTGRGASVRLTTYKKGSNYVVDGIRLIDGGTNYRDAVVTDVPNNLTSRITFNFDYRGGLFADPRRLLNATRVMVKVTLREDQIADTFSTDQTTFTRYGLIKDVVSSGNDTNFIAGSDTNPGQTQTFSNIKRVQVSSTSAIAPTAATALLRVGEGVTDKSKLSDKEFNILRANARALTDKTSKISSFNVLGSKAARIEAIATKDASNNKLLEIGDRVFNPSNKNEILTVSSVISEPTVESFTGTLISSNETNINVSTTSSQPREISFQYVYSLGNY